MGLGGCVVQNHLGGGLTIAGTGKIAKYAVWRRLCLCRKSSRFLSLPTLTAHCLFEEFFVSQMLTDLDVAPFFAEIKNLRQQWIVPFREFSFEAYSSGLYADLNGSVAAKDLVVAQSIPQGPPSPPQD
jgi:hypothetical protein